MLGLSAFKHLIISSVILSHEIISSLFDILLMLSKILLAIWKSNLAANLTALNILSGSSLKVSSGSNGVIKIPLFKSFIPPSGSIISPKFFSFKDIAIALIVKSLLSKSSSKVVLSTIGFLESST